MIEKLSRYRIIAIATWACATLSVAQQRPVPPPRVNPDLSVTYFLNVDANSVVLVDSVFAPAPPGIPLTKRPDGIWSVTTPPYEPGSHEYGFVIDGVPTGALTEMNVNDRLPRDWYPFDLVEVRGPEPLFHDLQQVPHGAVHIHTFHSGLFAREVSFYVYTPPGYEDATEFESTRRRASHRSYPVLYLLHAATQRESMWTRFGYADRIMDNLIAAGQAKEMMIVMPNTGTASGGDEPLDLVVRYMLEEVIPLVEKKYRADVSQKSRYVAGIGAGANRARELAFLRPELFSGVAILAGGGLGNAAAPLDVTYPKISDAATFNALVSRIFIAIGAQDDHTAGLQNNAKRLKDSLDKLGIVSTLEVTSGGYTWFNFRRFFAEFVKGL
jgi:enterochelin esterase-like enzyme